MSQITTSYPSLYPPINLSSSDAMPSAPPPPQGYRQSASSADPSSSLAPVLLAPASFPMQVLTPAGKEGGAEMSLASSAVHPVKDSSSGLQQCSDKANSVLLSLIGSMDFLQLEKEQKKSRGFFSKKHTEQESWKKIMENEQLKQTPEQQLLAAIAVAPEAQAGKLRLALVQYYVLSGQLDKAQAQVGFIPGNQQKFASSPRKVSIATQTPMPEVTSVVAKKEGIEKSFSAQIQIIHAILRDSRSKDWESLLSILEDVHSVAQKMQRMDAEGFKDFAPSLKDIYYQAYICYRDGLGTSKKPEEAQVYLVSAAECGHVEAMFQLGNRFLSENDNLDQAIKWLDAAAGLGHKEAFKVLEEWTVKTYKETAVNETLFKALNCAAERGSGDCQWYLSCQYWFGSKIVPRDRLISVLWGEKAKKNKVQKAIDDWNEHPLWYQLIIKADREKDLKAIYELGLGYDPAEEERERTSGVNSKNLEEAIRYYTMGVDAGHQDSLVKLVRCYENFLGKTNWAAALEVYLKAAEKGMSLAMYRLGVIFCEGRKDESCSIPMDKEKGMEWLRKASEKGSKAASEALAKMDRLDKLAKGDPEAIYQYALSLYQPDPKLDRIPEKDIPNWLKAEPHFKFAASKGHLQARTALAAGYRTNNEPEKAFKEYYLLATKYAQPDFMYEVAVCYWHGIGTEKDIIQGRRWVLEACKVGNKEAQADYEKALALYILIEQASKGNADVCHQFAKWYDPSKPSEFAQWIEKSDREAFLWYLKAGNAGNKEAAKTLATLYATGGLGVERSQAKAEEWEKRSK